MINKTTSSTKKHHFFALDLGATSGRSMLATIAEDGKLRLKELTRFPNKILRIHNKYYWDIFALFEYLKDGLSTAVAEGITLDAIGIDTWGVDFVYLGDDGSILGIPRAYRDPYTKDVPAEFFRKLSRDKLYETTGIQIMDFNTVFQLYAAKKENATALKAAQKILFMPDALSYLLTGKKICEYTIASTSQLLNPASKRFAPELFEWIGVRPDIVEEIVMPGTIAGYTTDEIRKTCGLTPTPVVAVAGHDTASAVAAVPATNERFAYLSSGTWSLMGIEVREPIITEQSCRLNFTNEGGVEGTVRFLKNITGMWLLEQCRKEWEAEGRPYTYPEITQMSESVAGFQRLIDPDDPAFAHPESMTKAIAGYCQRMGGQAPQTDAELVRCIFDSLALKYKYVFNCLQEVAPFKIERLHVIGGGSQNELLNRMTADAIGIPVVAGPSEATAIGNAMMQAKGVGRVGSLSEMRAVVRNSFPAAIFHPQQTAVWEKAYEKINHLYKL
jgi:rhamnulokinase